MEICSLVSETTSSVSAANKAASSDQATTRKLLLTGA